VRAEGIARNARPAAGNARPNAISTFSSKNIMEKISIRFRKLRIAWTAAWGAACVLLIVFWVRSYWWLDGLSYARGTTYVSIFTSTGIAGFNCASWPNGTRMGNKPGFEWVSFRVPAPPNQDIKPLMWVWRPEGPLITVPVWCCESVLVLSAALPWLRYRFSLRTLLIATTLFAVVLGLVVLAAHR